MSLFDDAIDVEAIKKLTPEQLRLALKILEKVK